MRIVVIGGSGLIGSRLADRLRQEGHGVIDASRSTGVDTLTGDGLPGAMEGAETAVDVSNPPASAGLAAPDFFLAQDETSQRQEGPPACGTLSCCRWSAQTASAMATISAASFCRRISLRDRAFPTPSCARRSSSSSEFMHTIAEAGSERGSVGVPVALVQPVAADDVAAALARIAIGAPFQGTVELAGPEELPLANAVRRVLAATGDPRPVAATSSMSRLRKRL